jgi:hypothetical protein
MQVLIKFRFVLLFVAILIYSSMIPSVFLFKSTPNIMFFNLLEDLVFSYSFFLFGKNFKMKEKLMLPIVISILSIFIFHFLPLRLIHTIWLGFSFEKLLYADYYAFLSNCMLNLILFSTVMFLYFFYKASRRKALNLTSIKPI